jgi:AcrR family transcriptional regulator
MPLEGVLNPNKGGVSLKERQKRKQSESPKGQVRTLMLNSAGYLFSTKGYTGTTVREIVASAGVSKPVLYYYFGSKKGIYFELMRGPFEKFDLLLLDSLQRKGSAREKLLDLCERVYALFCENIEAVRIMYSIYYGPPQGAPFIDFDVGHARFQDALRVLIREGSRNGEFRAVNVDDAMWAIAGALNVAVEVRLRSAEDILGRDGLTRILKIILSGIEASV